MADHGGNETVACMCSSQYTKVLDSATFVSERVLKFVVVVVVVCSLYNCLRKLLSQLLK